MRVFQNLNVDFMGKRRMFYILSSVIILAGIASFVVKGVKLGLDFKGGTEVVVRFPRTISIGELRTILNDANVGSFEVKSFGQDTDFIIRTDVKGQGMLPSQKIKNALSAKFNNAIDILQENRVEAKIGSEIRQDAIIAVFLSLIGIMVYIAFRFKWIFGVGAVASLFHDVLLTLGAVSLFTDMIPGINLEFDQSMVAAFLTLIGYSVNDTVVVFDRIRENLRLFKSHDIFSVVNRSVNQTMSRTVLTGLTSMATMCALLLFGGEPTRGFAFTMFIGLFTGTYSSIFVASAMTLDWALKRKVDITF